MTKNKLFLLQVRPIVLKKNIIFSEKVISDKLHLEFKIKKSFLSKEKFNIFGEQSFSQMSDWILQK